MRRRADVVSKLIVPAVDGKTSSRLPRCRRLPRVVESGQECAVRHLGIFDSRYYASSNCSCLSTDHRRRSVSCRARTSRRRCRVARPAVGRSRDRERILSRRAPAPAEGSHQPSRCRFVRSASCDSPATDTERRRQQLAVNSLAKQQRYGSQRWQVISHRLENGEHGDCENRPPDTPNPAPDE